MDFNQTFQNPTAKYVSYMSEPNGRGTVSLVCSCLVTLLLCVWSALHLNVPCQNASKAVIFWTNVKWIVIGIYAPELVVFTAWRQWSSARILARIVNECQTKDSRLHSATPVGGDPSSSIEKPLKAQYDWTMTHNFFASTGGFAFDLGSNSPDEESPEHEAFLPPDCPRRLHLTARGVALLAQCGYLPDIPEREIWDKSKASGLAKALVIIQATWMLIQVVGRLVVHLPVTLLEVNTVAHVLCAFLMYMMWWYKPLLADEPIILQGAWTRPLCAYMFMCSGQSGEVDSKEVQEQTVVKKAFVKLSIYSKTPEINRVRLRKLLAPVDEEGSSETHSYGDVRHNQVVNEHDARVELSSKRSLDHLRQKQLAGRSETTAFFERRPRLRMREDALDYLDNRTMRRWDLAAKAISSNPPLIDSSLLQHIHKVLDHGSESNQSSYCIHPSPVEYVTERVSNWPYDDLLRNVGGLTVGIVLWMCSFVYGGIHASAWNEHFPTRAEKWLWRGSCIYISFCGGLWIIINSVAVAFPRLNLFWESWMNGHKTWIYSIFLGGGVIICGSSFCASRVYLVVEAFLSIRSLPSEAYDTPAWSQIFPHF